VDVVPAPDRYAVLLNALAKGWTGETHQDVQKLIPAEDLYLTDNFRQAERTIDALLNRDYDIIFTGGGDGTIIFLVNALEKRIRNGELDREEAPPVGVLRMGSGNAIANFVGCGSAEESLRALRAGAPLSVHSLRLIDHGRGLVPFAGIGWDAEILNDYEAFKETVRDTAVEDYATGLTGYVAAIATRTLPRVLRQSPVHLTIENRGGRAFQIDAEGDVIREFGKGDQLFDGPVQTCAASAVSYWGYNLRMFPHATRKPGYFMMRCFNGSVGRLLRRLPLLWRGRLPEDDTSDFLVQNVRLETHESPMPYQVTGEAAGHESLVEWSVTPHPVRLAVPLT